MRPCVAHPYPIGHSPHVQQPPRLFFLLPRRGGCPGERWRARAPGWVHALDPRLPLPSPRPSSGGRGGSRGYSRDTEA
ncbi:Hypothetical protein AA314_00286 [Archangium gephyra]|uniref:Uncharacterized protein n=1 Tax=Archangium gephyra TaxID=48 RepID=A0AAC8Q0D5_9BACT|nr:Hypothetical protein AA314_00286 [Archangium gephyra]